MTFFMDVPLLSAVKYFWGVWGRPKGRRNFLCLNFSHFDIKYEFLLHKSFAATDRYKDQEEKLSNLKEICKEHK